MKYLDREGLTLTADVDAYIAALNLSYDTDQLPEPKAWRPGDVLFTGPWAVNSWTWLPKWVSIEVVPDGSKVEHLDPLTFALKQANPKWTSYRNKPPSERSKNYHTYLECVRWAEAHTIELVNIDVGEGAAPYKIVTDPQEATSIIHALHGKPFAWDWETTSKDAHVARPIGLALADEKMSWYLAQDALKACPEMVPLLQDPTSESRGSNVKYEYTVLHYLTGVMPTDLVPSFDTQPMHWLRHAGGQYGFQNDLKSQSRRLLNRVVLDFDDLVTKAVQKEAEAHGYASGLEWLQQTTEGLNLVARYAAAGDARGSWDLVEKHKQEMAQDITPTWDGTTNLLDFYNTFERGVTPILSEMEIAGLYIDQSVAQKLYVDFTLEQRQVEDELRQLGFRGNFDSPDDVAQWLYKEIKLPVLAMTDSGSRGKVDGPTLDLLIERFDHPAPELLKRRSERAKLVGTFLQPVVTSKVRHIHMSLMQTSTGTGRLSAKNPNTENQPSKLRGMFIADPDDPDDMFWAADFSQEEPRMGAVISGDQAMLYPYLQPPYVNGKENHRADAYKVLGLQAGFDPIKVLNKDKTTRTIIKACYLGVGMYGGGPRKLQEKLREAGVKKTLDECREMQVNMDAAIPDYVHYRNTQPNRARSDGGAAFSMNGRREWIPELFYKDPTRRGNGERKAINMPIQGTGADQLKLAMQRIHPMVREAGGYQRNPIHDELTGTWSVYAEKELGQKRDEIMAENPWVPLRVESGYSRDWGSAKP